jgi:hypothetical protein
MKTSKEKQDKRKAEMQAAAERDGFETWSQALTAWKNGEARLTLPAPDKGDSPAPGNLSTLKADTTAEHEPTPAPCG